MTTVGLVGSGQLGGAIARLAVDAGQHVAAALGPRTSAATSGEDATAGASLVVTVPVKAFPDLLRLPLVGKTVVDTCNHGPDRPVTLPPAGGARPFYLPVAGGSASVKAVVAELVESLGYGVVDAGSLADSWRQAIHAGVGDPVGAVLEREGPAGRLGRRPGRPGPRDEVTERGEWA
ncbi:MAG: hypothetical protein ACRYG2_07660 [Janthinobacterium lividum]